jgi:hypothetical protein
MPDFTLTAVQTPPKPWSGQYGDFHIYDVSFTGEQGQGDAQIKQKASSPAPTVGQVIDAEIVPKPGFPSELKRIPKQQNGFAAGGRDKSPQESRQIARMAAQKAAIELLRMELDTGIVSRESLKASELLTPRIDFFFNDILKAGESA